MPLFSSQVMPRQRRPQQRQGGFNFDIGGGSSDNTMAALMMLLQMQSQERGREAEMDLANKRFEEEKLFRAEERETLKQQREAAERAIIFGQVESAERHRSSQYRERVKARAKVLKEDFEGKIRGGGRSFNAAFPHLARSLGRLRGGLDDKLWADLVAEINLLSSKFPDLVNSAKDPMEKVGLVSKLHQKIWPLLEHPVVQGDDTLRRMVGALVEQGTPLVATYGMTEEGRKEYVRRQVSEFVSESEDALAGGIRRARLAGNEMDIGEGPVPTRVRRKLLDEHVGNLPLPSFEVQPIRPTLPLDPGEAIVPGVPSLPERFVEGAREISRDVAEPFFGREAFILGEDQGPPTRPGIFEALGLDGTLDTPVTTTRPINEVDVPVGLPLTQRRDTPQTETVDPGFTLPGGILPPGGLMGPRRASPEAALFQNQSPILTEEELLNLLGGGPMQGGFR